MSERLFRSILGILLFIALTLSSLIESQMPVYIVMGLMAFEAITNWRIPIIVTRLRYGADYKQYLDNPLENQRLLGKIEAERFLRLAVILFVGMPFLFPSNT